MILVTETMLVGIKVTIAKTHSPLEPFFEMWRPLAASKNMAITGLFVAPDNFVHEEENVATALLRNVYHELWLTIEIRIDAVADDVKTCVTIFAHAKRIEPLFTMEFECFGGGGVATAGCWL
ncbi:hypothetical protein PF001_g32085 [Phytophthora fragariae]|uniref:Uncharacterized protein n=1 Tax=Phytophthora fragariae TaxID=53985 RepID=A0A6A4AXQ5_9STRA|nr:hypothetical protein PF001_g32085 [Phytophthora fragariae]